MGTGCGSEREVMVRAGGVLAVALVTGQGRRGWTGGRHIAGVGRRSRITPGLRLGRGCLISQLGGQSRSERQCHAFYHGFLKQYTPWDRRVQQRCNCTCGRVGAYPSWWRGSRG